MTRDEVTRWYAETVRHNARRSMRMYGEATRILLHAIRLYLRARWVLTRARWVR